MRLKVELILNFEVDDKQPQNEIVREYRRQYKTMSEILDKHPEILAVVHRDLQSLGNTKSRRVLSARGRKADFTTENLFRAILVMQREGLDYREASVRIAEGQTLQQFCRLMKKPTIDFTLLNKAFCAIQPTTWEMVNHILGLKALEEGCISVNHIRTDTTVTECNIHWPTDSSLLWDVYRVIAREMSSAREVAPASYPWRFHSKKIKGIHLFITRYSSSTNKKRLRNVKKKMRILIERTEEVVRKAEVFIAGTASSTYPKLIAIGKSLSESLPAMRQAVDVARRREFDDEKVPHTDKVFSIFEPHTEMIMRGRREKPVEFGHKVLLTQSREKFITDYVVFEKSESDKKLLPMVLERHEQMYGVRPESVAGDNGFCPDDETYEELAETVGYLGVPRRMSDYGDDMMRIWQHWRAGIEGTISCLLPWQYKLSRQHR